MMNYQAFVEETKNMIVNNSEWMIEDDFQTNDGLVYSYIGLNNDPSYVEEYILAMQNCGAIISRGEETFASEEGKKLVKEWGVPDNYICQAFVILGYIDGEQPHSKPRKPGRIQIVE